MADINEGNRITFKTGFSCNFMNFCFKSTSGFISTRTHHFEIVIETVVWSAACFNCNDLLHPLKPIL